ncbi:MAG: 4'-phosphopantetheinyl transferase superfamily protein [Bacteroidetes bacterium]|uniref:4'-phosphopantetheinyl transferase family protein n=1 Tax=Flavobacterium sp. TaxID=239 RepID=UPI002FD9E4B1|nr:4'-phosphopantetheinyl transferase superfamily protein [Bacteroidota bacterium]
MPLQQIISLKYNTKIFVWKISESFNELFRSVVLKDVSLARVENMKAESHQKGFLAVRKLLEVAGYDDFDLYYDDFGKPNLKDGKHISISHSNDFSVIAVSDCNLGIDIEILKDKTLKLAPRYMDVSHLENLSKEEALEKATVIWGIKESIFKIKNIEGISFKNHIFEKKFELSVGKCSAELRFENQVEQFNIQHQKVDSYILVIAFRAN